MTILHKGDLGTSRPESNYCLIFNKIILVTFLFWTFNTKLAGEDTFDIRYFFVFQQFEPHKIFVPLLSHKLFLLCLWSAADLKPFQSIRKSRCHALIRLQFVQIFNSWLISSQIKTTKSLFQTQTVKINLKTCPINWSQPWQVNCPSYWRIIFNTAFEWSGKTVLRNTTFPCQINSGTTGKKIVHPGRKKEEFFIQEKNV